MYTPKTDKERAILERIKHLYELDGTVFNGYININELVDIIAQIAFGCKHKRTFYGDTIYPEDDTEYRKLMAKIHTVICNMAEKKIITISKSKKAFKLN